MNFNRNTHIPLEVLGSLHILYSSYGNPIVYRVYTIIYSATFALVDGDCCGCCGLESIGWARQCCLEQLNVSVVDFSVVDRSNLLFLRINRIRSVLFGLLAAKNCLNCDKRDQFQ